MGELDPRIQAQEFLTEWATRAAKLPSIPENGASFPQLITVGDAQNAHINAFLDARSALDPTTLEALNTLRREPISINPSEITAGEATAADAVEHWLHTLPEASDEQSTPSFDQLASNLFSIYERMAVLSQSRNLHLIQSGEVVDGVRIRSLFDDRCVFGLVLDLAGNPRPQGQVRVIPNIAHGSIDSIQLENTFGFTAIFTRDDMQFRIDALTALLRLTGQFLQRIQ